MHNMLKWNCAKECRSTNACSELFPFFCVQFVGSLLLIGIEMPQQVDETSPKNHVDFQYEIISWTLLTKAFVTMFSGFILACTCKNIGQACTLRG